jgi:hypothetical protein
MPGLGVGNDANRFEQSGPKIKSMIKMATYAQKKSQVWKDLMIE